MLDGRLLAVLASMLLIGLLTPADAQWNSKGSGDCGGRDIGCSKGGGPDNRRCHAETEGMTAVCWDNRPSGYPASFQQQCGGAAAWCTYKSIGASQCVGGRAPGRMYECSARGWRQPIQGAEMRVFHINPVRDSKTPYDSVAECLNDNVCSTILSAAAAYAGVPPNVMQMAKTSAFVYNVVAPSDSEKSRYSIEPPQGMKVCHVSIKTLSVVPNTGDRASLMSITGRSSKVEIYTWTPKQGVGQGRSWYDGYITVTFAPNSVPADRCSLSGELRNYGCRGGQGVESGTPRL